MSPKELAEDLAYVRTLAEEGRSAPLLGGAFLVFWGILNSAAFLIHWSLTQALIDDLNGAAFAILWALYGCTAGVGMALLIRRIRVKPGLTATAVRAERAIWMSMGLGMCAVALGAIGRAIFEQDWTAPNGIPPVGAAFCGTALLATSWMSGQRWLAWFALLSFVAALIVSVLANVDNIYIASAAATVATLVIPGLILLRREPADVA